MRSLKRLTLAVAVLLCGAIAFGCYGAYWAYYSSSASVANFMKAIPPSEREVPLAVRRAVGLVHPGGIRHIAIRRVFAAVRPMPEREVVQRARLVVWEVLFPMHYSAEETLGAYAHTLVCEAGQGLDAAAAFYYRKRPLDLTDDEALALVVMDLNPTGYSMRENPKRLAEAVRQFEEGRRPTRR